MEGIIFDIKRMALHDGPGIRQTVFFKGCPLRCLWCHNPESCSKEITDIEISEKMDGKLLKKKQTIGRMVNANDLMRELLRDTLVYEESGGGVTFSGGEPLMQPDFLLQVLRLCKKNEINTCIDTTGYTAVDNLQKVIPYTDLFLYDLKHPQTDDHRKYTGVGNELILQNLHFLDNHDAKIRIRIPLLPTINDSETDLLATINILSKLKRKYPVDLLPYHKIGNHKYSRFQLPFQMPEIEEPTTELLQQVKHFFEQHGHTTTIGG